MCKTEDYIFLVFSKYLPLIKFIFQTENRGKVKDLTPIFCIQNHSSAIEPQSKPKNPVSFNLHFATTTHRARHGRSRQIIALVNGQ